MTQRHEGAHLFVYFAGESTEDGEQVRFAVSDGPTMTSWTEINSGLPTLRSTVGECGARDPFILRDSARDRFVVIATDLRVWPDEDWKRAIEHGSRAIVVWESADLVTWTEPRLATVAPHNAGNAWAPKAFWSDASQAWTIIWASALYPDGIRGEFEYQRLLMTTTRDFQTFTPTEMYLDVGHDVIDATFLTDGDATYRFSANSHNVGETGPSKHVFMERGTSVFDPAFMPLVVDVGKNSLEFGEGPAVGRLLDRDGWFLLIDESNRRGYRLFESTDLDSGEWTAVEDAALPVNARHGSVIAITREERDRLLAS
jgi:hypothetical protein